MEVSRTPAVTGGESEVVVGRVIVIGENQVLTPINVSKF